MMLGKDGVVCREAADSGLQCLIQAMRPLHCRQLHERLTDDDDRLILLAFGEALAVSMLSAWPQPAGCGV